MIAELEYKDDHLLYVLHGNFIINQNYEKRIPVEHIALNMVWIALYDEENYVKISVSIATHEHPFFRFTCSQSCERISLVVLEGKRTEEQKFSSHVLIDPLSSATLEGINYFSSLPCIVKLKQIIPSVQFVTIVKNNVKDNIINLKNIYYEKI